MDELAEIVELGADQVQRLLQL
ncbi:MAG: hypothetical protein LBI53_04475 [Candidatus Peribacteria bacterium]|nr:hypothetical protein [Candidatus Peribacteria bacterium]